MLPVFLKVWNSVSNQEKSEKSPKKLLKFEKCISAFPNTENCSITLNECKYCTQFAIAVLKGNSPEISKLSQNSKNSINRWFRWNCSFARKFNRTENLNKLIVLDGLSMQAFWLNIFASGCQTKVYQYFLQIPIEKFMSFHWRLAYLPYIAIFPIMLWIKNDAILLYIISLFRYLKHHQISKEKNHQMIAFFSGHSAKMFCTFEKITFLQLNCRWE